MPRLNKSFDSLVADATKRGIDVTKFEAIRALDEDAATTALYRIIKKTKVGRGNKSAKSNPVGLFSDQHNEALQELLIRYREVETAINDFNEANGTKLILDMESPNLVKVKGSRTRRATSPATASASGGKTVYDWAGFAAKLKANKASNKLVLKTADGEMTGTLQLNGNVKDADGTYENISAWTKLRTAGRAGNPYKITRILHNGFLGTVEKAYNDLMK